MNLLLNCHLREIHVLIDLLLGDLLMQESSRQSSKSLYAHHSSDASTEMENAPLFGTLLSSYLPCWLDMTSEYVASTSTHRGLGADRDYVTEERVRELEARVQLLLEERVHLDSPPEYHRANE